MYLETDGFVLKARSQPNQFISKYAQKYYKIIYIDYNSYKILHAGLAEGFCYDDIVSYYTSRYN